MHLTYLSQQLTPLNHSVSVIPVGYNVLDFHESPELSTILVSSSSILFLHTLVEVRTVLGSQTYFVDNSMELSIGEYL